MKRMITRELVKVKRTFFVVTNTFFFLKFRNDDAAFDFDDDFQTFEEETQEGSPCSS